MIEILLAKVNQLSNRLIKLSTATTSDLYGTGSLGNVFYGLPGQAPDGVYDTVYNNASTYRPTLNGPLHYKNLTISQNVSLLSWSDYLTIMVQDTLTLRGTISVANTHSGNYVKTAATPTYLEQIKMYGESRFLVDSDFFITGGTGNPAFGNSDKGGGCIAIYYDALKQDNENQTERDSWGTCLRYLGGSTSSAAGTSSGGCVIIAARNIVIADTGHIDAYGGDNSNTNTAGIVLTYKLGGVDL